VGIGDDAAARFYEASLRTLLARVRGLDLRREIAYAEHSEADLAWFQQFEGYELWPQPPGDLGVKLTAWFEYACASDDRVLVIGSDSPTLPLEYITKALAALDHHNDCVIGPAEDGGYYLLGLRRPVPQLFERISWSSPLVIAQTCARAVQQELQVAVLPYWNDVDEVDDLAVLRDQLKDWEGDPLWGPLRLAVDSIDPACDTDVELLQ
jgi:uncharacterized protein